MRKLYTSLLPLFLLISIYSSAQEKLKIKFGDISAADFATKIYEVDSNASAVFIADMGTSKIEGNTKGWFSLVYKRFARIHILNKNGYDAANVSIPIYTSGQAEEELDKLKAVTYNLENGKVVETKLDVKNQVFKDKISNNLIIKKFTLPNVREGSIIEIEYTILSDFLANLQPWEFQGQHPRLWSEYNLTVPDFLGYVFLSQGYHSYAISESKVNDQDFRVTDRGFLTSVMDEFRFNSRVRDHRWVMKNVPGLKEESFTSSLRNHLAKIEFQLTEYRYPLKYTNLLGDWNNMGKKLMEAEYFGEQLNKENGWLKDYIKPVIQDAPDELTKAKRIFSYVRDNLTCTDYSSLGMYQNMKNILKSKNGNVAEINLLLTAMLKYANITAEPVILSTRSHGFTLELYPLPSKFNYVICQAQVDGKTYYLDASERKLGFGFLPLRCYNGHARVVSKNCLPVEFNADDITETKTTTLFIVNDEKGNLVGSMLQFPGYYESFRLRERIKEKGQDDLLKDIRRNFGAAIEISNPKFDSLDIFDQNIGISYEFDIKDEKEDIMYINPLFGEGYKENPFKSAKRLYPVEMPHAFDETYNLHFEIPVGYEVDELPKQMIVKLNEQEDGLFEYRISQSGGTISLRSRVIFKRANFTSEEYDNLREFFNLIVKKQNEQIVFKKKK